MINVRYQHITLILIYSYFLFWTDERVAGRKLLVPNGIFPDTP